MNHLQNKQLKRKFMKIPQETALSSAGFFKWNEHPIRTPSGTG